MSNDRIKGNLDTLLLTVVQSGQAHGYEIIAELKTRSQGEFDLPEGTSKDSVCSQVPGIPMVAVAVASID
jgi:hypothetical protein